jgi:hypothetical protein
MKYENLDGEIASAEPKPDLRALDLFFFRARGGISRTDGLGLILKIFVKIG